jgi:hypothetical protein
MTFRLESNADHQVLPGNGDHALEAEKLEPEKHGEEEVDGGEAKSDEVVLVDIQLVEVLEKYGLVCDNFEHDKTLSAGSSR